MWQRDCIGKGRPASNSEQAVRRCGDSVYRVVLFLYSCGFHLLSRFVTREGCAGRRLIAAGH